MTILSNSMVWPMKLRCVFNKVFLVNHCRDILNCSYKWLCFSARAQNHDMNLKSRDHLWQTGLWISFIQRGPIVVAKVSLVGIKYSIITPAFLQETFGTGRINLRTSRTVLNTAETTVLPKQASVAQSGQFDRTLACCPL